MAAFLPHPDALPNTSMCRLMSDHEVTLVNDSMQEFFVRFHGPAESELCTSPVVDPVLSHRLIDMLCHPPPSSFSPRCPRLYDGQLRLLVECGRSTSSFKISTLTSHPVSDS
jgi:hypothetical protein